jgi:hypothetical protein
MDASDAEAMPLPSEDTTPPVTKIREVMVGPFVERHILAARLRARDPADFPCAHVFAIIPDRRAKKPRKHMEQFGVLTHHRGLPWPDFSQHHPCNGRFP